MAKNIEETARGMGRYHRRMGLSLELAVEATKKAHPELPSDQVEVGWKRERAGR